jgi:organic radical activating enzyme
LRFKGCNLSCEGCDEPDSLHITSNDIKYELDDIVSKIEFYYQHYKIKNLMITGGEPLLYQKQIIELLMLCKDINIYFDNINIETNGTIVDLHSFFKQDNILFSISPKIGALKSNIKVKEELFLQNIDTLYSEKNNKYNFIIKLVINPDNLSLLDKIESLDKKYATLNQLKYEKKIYLMPLGKNRKEQIERSQKLIDICINRNYEFSPRLHILIYDEKKNI